MENVIIECGVPTHIHSETSHMKHIKYFPHIIIKYNISIITSVLYHQKQDPTEHRIQVCKKGKIYILYHNGYPGYVFPCYLLIMTVISNCLDDIHMLDVFIVILSLIPPQT